MKCGAKNMGREEDSPWSAFRKFSPFPVFCLPVISLSLSLAVYLSLSIPFYICVPHAGKRFSCRLFAACVGHWKSSPSFLVLDARRGSPLFSGFYLLTHVLKSSLKTNKRCSLLFLSPVSLNFSITPHDL